MQLVREPIYQQINTLLRELLGSEEFSEGDQFLTERQIVERFKVSRPTANKVLSGMVSEGLLEFRKGVGTFVSKRRLDYDLRGLVSFTRKAEQAGKRPGTKVLEFEKIRASEAGIDVMTHLGVAEDEMLFEIARLRLADGEPVILERRWVPVALCPTMSRAELRGSIYSLWTDKEGLQITSADQTIQAVNLKGTDAKLLVVKPGAAGFLVLATGYLQNRALWRERTLYRGDAYEFHHHGPAPGRLIATASRSNGR